MAIDATLTAVIPNTGYGFAAVTLIGLWPDGPSAPITVTFGGVLAINLVVVDNNHITCQVPYSAVAGPVDVQVFTIYGNPTLVNGFTYQITNGILVYGGNFQDAQGNPLANGYLTFRLNTDAMVANSPNIQVGAGRVVNVTLGLDGNVYGAFPIWGNDVLQPSGTVYIVHGYSAAGELVWNNQMTITGSSTFDLGSWVPSNL